MGIVMVIALLLGVLAVPSQNAQAAKKVYTPKDFHLPDDLYKYKGIEIKKLTSKYIKYQKVKLQDNKDADYGWFPYHKRIYKMKYSKKIDIYLLKDAREPRKWVKAYSGINYKKVKKCLDKNIKYFTVIKNKKGTVTKIIQLFTV